MFVVVLVAVLYSRGICVWPLVVAFNAHINKIYLIILLLIICHELPWSFYLHVFVYISVVVNFVIV
jgi:hypothetical protein